MKTISARIREIIHPTDEEVDLITAEERERRAFRNSGSWGRLCRADFY